MTSKDPVMGCFVFIHLPGETTPVVCGRFEQRAEGSTTEGRFTYGRTYRARPDAVPIDPEGMALQEGTLPATIRLGGIYPALRDAAPDAWGRRVIEYARGVREALSEVEYLLGAGVDRAGALSFGTEAEALPLPTGHHGTTRLPDLLDAAERLETDAPATPDMIRAAQLLLHEFTMGGARPKAVIEDAGALWIAKFPGRGDRFSHAAAEAACLTVAAACGMDVPEHRTVQVGNRLVLLVRRFERRGAPAAPERARYLSALTLLGGDETFSKEWSYLKLADALRKRSNRPTDDRRELFRRMVLNALVSNGDDHPRNHAIIAWTADDWHLAPLFDVVPTHREWTRARDLALIAGDQGRRATRANLLSAANVFGMTPEEATAVIDRTRDLLRETWETAFLAHGGTADEAVSLRHAINPAGFEDP